MLKGDDLHMRYFASELLPRLKIYGSENHTDLSSLTTDCLLRSVVIAISSTHQITQARRTGTKSTCETSLVAQQNALQMLRRTILDSQAKTIAPSLFEANVLLCILHGMIEPSRDNTSTRHHLAGGKTILDQWHSASQLLATKQRLPTLMLSIFATMDVVNAILTGERPLLDASIWAEFGGCEAWWGNVPADDDMLEAMSIISQLAAHGHDVKTSNCEIPVGVMLSMQTALYEQTCSFPTNGEMVSSNTQKWFTFCLIYRIAGSIYFYRALAKLPMDHLLVRQAVKRCLELMSVLDGNLRHCLFLPLILVGPHCALQGERAQVQRLLSDSAAYLSFGAIAIIEDFFVKAWGRADRRTTGEVISWWDTFGDIAYVVCMF